MKYRIVIWSRSIKQATGNYVKIGSLTQENDTISRGGQMIEVLTEYPENFIARYFEEGFTETFTCQQEN